MVLQRYYRHTAKILESNQTTAQFGGAVSNAGDINNDGYDDIIVGAQLYDNGQTDEVLRSFITAHRVGIKSAPFTMIESNQTLSRFGCAVSTAGDVNNDGTSDDVVVVHISLIMGKMKRVLHLYIMVAHQELILCMQ
ncbi:MAG: FG-GAP repeat protein [Bacteroidetes bacterium]|nr:FG-GAP repeat protein [Bacteroidota bacterium]